MIIDADGHLYEPPDMWATHLPVKQRHLALSVKSDDLGYPILHIGDRPTSVVVHGTVPGDFAIQGRTMADRRAGLPNPGMRLSDFPEAYWHPAARAAATSKWGVDLAVLFPQTGFIWEYLLAEDLAATQANMTAWNRWAAEVVADGHGALQPVGHVTLQGADTSWLEDELTHLSQSGVRLAMFSPMQVNGKRMSHPDNDHIWELFVANEIFPAWHVNFRMAAIFDNPLGWSDNDNDSFLKVVTGIFQPVSVQLGLADLAANGVFEKYPTLRVVLAEVGTHWLSTLPRRLDTIYDIHRTTHGRELTPSLRLKPSEYIARQVLNVCSFPSDADRSLLEDHPANFAFGADWPHPEGVAKPLADYQELLGPLDGELSERFYGDNMAHLLSLV